MILMVRVNMKLIIKVDQDRIAKFNNFTI